MQDYFSVPTNDQLEGLCSCSPDIIYSESTGVSLPMTLIIPWTNRYLAEQKILYPCIVFISGSAYTTPDRFLQLPQLCWYASKGYVVATIVHRSCKQGHPYPAYLQDVKTALRFLRKNSAKYSINAEKIGIFGTSSGGNMSLMTGMTANDPRFETEEHAGYSDGVSCVVDCYGPTDNVALCYETHTISELLFKGDAEYCRTLARESSPLYAVNEDTQCAPMLLLHGTADTTVPFSQTQAFFERMKALHKDVRMVRVHGGQHGVNFYSIQLHEIILAYLNEHLK